jgi:hypothetical protein
MFILRERQSFSAGLDASYLIAVESKREDDHFTGIMIVFCAEDTAFGGMHRDFLSLALQDCAAY